MPLTRTEKIGQVVLVTFWCRVTSCDAQADDRTALRMAQDDEYQRAADADEARQRLEAPVDLNVVRATRLRRWLQSP